MPVFENLLKVQYHSTGTCTSLTDSPGLFGRAYAVMDLAGQPDNWMHLQEQCILEGVLNGDGLVYR